MVAYHDAEHAAALKAHHEVVHIRLVYGVAIRFQSGLHVLLLLLLLLYIKMQRRLSSPGRRGHHRPSQRMMVLPLIDMDMDADMNLTLTSLSGTKGSSTTN